MTRKTVNKIETWESLKPIIEDQIEEALNGLKSKQFVYGYVFGVYRCDIMPFNDFKKYSKQLGIE